MLSEKELYNFAYYSLQAGRYTESQQSFRLLLLMNSSNPVYWLGLSEASIRCRDDETAEESLRVAEKLLKNEEYAHSPMNEILMKLTQEFEGRLP